MLLNLTDVCPFLFSHKQIPTSGMLVVTMDMHLDMKTMDMPRFPKILICTMVDILGTEITSSSHNSSSKWDIVEVFGKC